MSGIDLKNKSGKRIQRVSLKLASGVSVLVLISMLLLGWLSGEGPFLTVAIVSLVAFAATYLGTDQLVGRRIREARKTLSHVRKHHFDRIEVKVDSVDDEIDKLNLEIVKTARKYERELADLRRVENYRRKFIGNVSHELKTPIFAILGFSDTLLDGAIDDETVRRSFVQKINRNAERLQNLARDLTEISRLETGEIPIILMPFDIRELLQDVMDSLESVASAQGVSISVGASEDLGYVIGDAKRIRQVLVNLIDNAIKYTDRNGRITITVRPDDASYLRIAVQDTGIGIDEENLSRITERFFRVDQSRSRALGGTGLGLAIVKHILAAHDQGLEISSRPGSGSTFSFRLKVAQNE